MGLGDGMVTTEDVPTVLQRCGAIGQNVDWFILMEYLDAVDPYARGLLDFQQFLHLLSRYRMPLVTQSEIAAAFRVFDKSKGDSIQTTELLHVMQTLGDHMTPDEADEMVLQCDPEGTGTI